THGSADVSPRWSPDGRHIYFLSSRSGSMQVWRLPLAGGEAQAVTALPLDLGGFTLSPDGKSLAVSMEVFPECPETSESGSAGGREGAAGSSPPSILECTTAELERRAASGETGRVYDRLFVRHWDTWKDGRRSQLFTTSVPGVGEEPASTAVHVSAEGDGALDADIPSKPFGGFEEIVWTPDSKGLIFTARVAGAAEPWSTNFDLYHASADGTLPPKRLTENPAWDTQPGFSPDGRTLAYLAMARPGFESDRRVLVLRTFTAGAYGPELGEPRLLTQEWDRSVGGFFFAADGRTVYATAGDVGKVGLFAIDVETAEVSTVFRNGHVRSPARVGDRFVFGLDTLVHPVDLFTLPVEPAGAEPRAITRVNRERLAEIEMGAYEQFSFAGWNGETVYGYLVKPAGFRDGERYPVAFLIHGGPQGTFDDDFHYRWNSQVYTGAGYAVVMIDFHGSTGYGQAFTDSITGDWGGKPLEDLQKGWASVLERYPFLDGERACALGASYGGYMINWIAGAWPDAFDCLVNHDGLFDMKGMYFSTEELWFPEWEMGGTPWENPAGYERHDPMSGVDRWQTPMLVIHGALDYRVVDTQGLATFTALQRRGIPSRLLYFPDENHWVLKPQNSKLWHQTVRDWLDRWTRT
ncbi:MAG: S9 family peptidase, partial [Holophagales bacterium]|nr:S9 family peptidase [Holophagales bacterium]